MSKTSEFAYGPPPAGGFYAYRPIVVPTDLDLLRGPLEGVVRIPSHIDTSARAWYDLADPRRREMLYAVVILEAWKDEDFAAWLNRDALVECWPRLSLPRPVRAALVAHGLVDRPTEDVDLFSPGPGGPGAVAYVVRDALVQAGYEVQVTRLPEAHQGEFARLEVARGDDAMHVDLARDW